MVMNLKGQVTPSSRLAGELTPTKQSLKGSTTPTKSGGTTDYNKLVNKPQINSIELVDNKTLGELGIPTRTSQLENDGAYISSNEVSEFSNLELLELWNQFVE